ncbi:transcription antitermination factor NusB [Borrelia miyamotoi]|uniref:Transcription antitermination protein NusB n=1 Tax=Borrelia miyamotoi TaxID=47466 RepID=A0AAX3JN69_9SPIR|nr:transcription antitermination factor NusB [Borrelia miyamotoi]QFP42189.1 transcription antitermination factor NusB [Borrelia miyamotoi]QFP48303.1 transcription antitermination factor NusB [Borrelia miyamotoi]QGT56064.1 transcription antitermination factor NusB [Borrelia miyamotoi]QGT56844.1 transcription antitermination factor NusB [Borrelia miyamotoi]WAZ72109.1 transcription antitermination factor NusB [Borrelia miyamotoi]
MDLRHKARVLAFQKIYSIDINFKARDDIYDILSLEDHVVDLEEELKLFYSFLVNGTYDNLESIDKLISDISLNWRLDRMDKVDLAILRMSVYSLKFQNLEVSVSKRVVIDEAILIAKKYGSKNSYKFINGILDALLKNMESSFESN